MLADAASAQRVEDVRRIREEARRLHDGPSTVWAILYLGAVLALVAVRELYVGHVHDAFNAVDLPGRCISGVFVQEISASRDLLLI